ncbi:MAG: hypothetical protein IJO85_07540 [Lachnospiraceae bacterium]|nr:hypothetical protein [Lachnospiraceae bacterium]
MEFVYDRTYEDVKNRTSKGYLNAADLNRVENNIDELAGYVDLELETKQWDIGGLPRQSDFERILSNISKLKEYFAILQTTPVAPVQPLNSYQKWNDIERILFDMYSLYMRSVSNKYYCGEDIGCGDEIGVI